MTRNDQLTLSYNMTTNNQRMDLNQFWKQAEGLWIGGEFIYKQEQTDLTGNCATDYVHNPSVRSLACIGNLVEQLSKTKFLAGWMSGPLCAICPKGTGRNGDFKSDTPCEPCPTDSSTNAWIVFGMVVAVLAVVVLFVYGQIKKGAHEIHLEQEHIREHNSKEHSDVAGDGADDDDDNNTDNNDNDGDGDDDSSSEFSGSNPMNNKKVTTKRRRGRRESRVYVHERTNFSTDKTMLSLQEHKQLQRDHGTLSGKLMSHKQVLTGMSRIMMSYLQVVAIARAVPIQWPKEVIAVLDAFATVSAPSLSLVSVDCALGGKLAENLQSQAAEQAGLVGNVGLSMIFQKFIMVMLLPLFAVLIPIIFWTIYYGFGVCCLHLQKKNKKGVYTINIPEQHSEAKIGCRKCFPWVHEMPSKESNFMKYQTLGDVNGGELWLRTTQRFKITVMVRNYCCFLVYLMTVDL